MVKNLPEIFNRLGFTKHASAIYATIQNRGPILATDIATVTKVHRPTLYRALQQLLNAKLIAIKKSGKRKHYVTEGAQRISELFLKDLDSLTRITKKRVTSEEETVNSFLKIFRGPRGIRAVFDDVIEHTKRNDTFYRYTSETDLESVNRYLSPNYHTRRDKKRLDRLVISNYVSGSKKRPRLERFIKFIPSDTPFEQNIIQIIYGKRIAFIDLNTEQAIIIENAELADFQKVIFKQLYNKL